MKKKQIIAEVAELVFMPKHGKDPEFAYQLFIERLCIPEDVESYSMHELEMYLNNAWAKNISAK